VVADRGAEAIAAFEQHLALVGEVAEERALGESGARRDLGHGGLVVAPLGIELERRLLQASGGIRLPTTHARNATAITANVIA